MGNVMSVTSLSPEVLALLASSAAVTVNFSWVAILHVHFSIYSSILKQHTMYLHISEYF